MPDAVLARAADPKVMRSYATFVRVVRIIFILLGLGMIVLNSYFLYYMHQLETHGCKCALGWRRQFIQVSLALFIMLQLVGFAVDWQSHFMWLAIAYQALFISYVFITRSFIHDVRKANCGCATTTPFRVLDYVNIIQIVSLAVMLLVLLLAVAYYLTVSRALSLSPSSAAASRKR